MANHVTSGRGKRWHHHLTVDLFASVLSNSIFHPFVACIIPLCLRSLQAPYDSNEFIASCIYASLITSLWMLAIVNNRLAYGPPREIDWDEEVVVITGGASGLGKILADMYGMRGASVAILDVSMPEEAKEREGWAGVQYYQCDVGDHAAVETVKGQIERDLGAPTILINNAGIVNGKPLLELTAQEVQRNFNVNLISHFHTLRAFLPAMLASDTGGTVVTVASVLGKISASHLSDYCAAKAALIAMHASLRAELSSSSSAPEGARHVRTILVTPGQLATPLFGELDTPSTFFGPVVEPVELARAIVKMVDAGESGEISMPFYARWVEWTTILPASMDRAVRWMSGLDQAMEKVHVKRKRKAAKK